MSNNQIFNTDLIRIDEIIINNANIVNNSDCSHVDVENHYFDLNYSFSNSVNISQKKFKTMFSCEINTFNKSDEKIALSGKFDLVFVFHIENIENLIIHHEHMLINSELIVALANIAYATSRGIIYTRCQGTMLDKAILPILSTQQLIDLLQPFDKSSDI